MEYARYTRVTRGDRIDSVLLTPEEMAGAREVMEAALPKCMGWPAYAQESVEAYGNENVVQIPVTHIAGSMAVELSYAEEAQTARAVA